MGQRGLARRIADIIEAVHVAGPGVSLARLAEATDLPKPTASRIANDLVERNLLDRTPSGYRLGVHLATLGASAARQHPIAIRARPLLTDLQAMSGAIVFLSVPDDQLGARLLDIADPGSMLLASRSLPWRHTETLPTALTSTATGRLALAFRPEFRELVDGRPLPRSTSRSVSSRRVFDDILRRARDERVLVEREEYVRGYCCISSGVTDGADELTAMITMVGWVGIFEPSRGRRALETASVALGM